MATPTENLDAIEQGLILGKRDSVEANYPWFNDAQSALAELRQQIADLTLYYRLNTNWTSSNFEMYAALIDRINSFVETPADDTTAPQKRAK